MEALRAAGFEIIKTAVYLPWKLDIGIGYWKFALFLCNCKIRALTAMPALPDPPEAPGKQERAGTEVGKLFPLFLPGLVIDRPESYPD